VARWPGRKHDGKADFADGIAPPRSAEMKVSARAVRIKDVRDGGDVKDGIRLGQRVVAGVVAERAFVAERFARVNVAFDVRHCGTALGKTVFKFGQNHFNARPTRRNQIGLRPQTSPMEFYLMAKVPTFYILTDSKTNVRFKSVSTITKTDSAWFTTKGQIVIPAWLRKQFEIQDGTKAIVQATPEGILLKPVTAALIKRGRGILKRKPGDRPLAEEWAEHKKQEKELEERHAR
jgi:AbrB family looped-hinge helix DNA binding protein